MSAILGFVGSSHRAWGPDLLKGALPGLSGRAADHCETVVWSNAALGVLRADWEQAGDFNDRTLVLTDGPLAIVADATLYYQADLLDKLSKAGIRAAGTTASHLILAAYQAFGVECARHLEGDFAFLVWDAHAGLLMAARDFSGRRPLYHAAVEEGCLIASTLAAIRGFPGFRAALNLGVLGETASGIIATHQETCETSIEAVPPGTTLTYRVGRGVTIARHWELPSEPPAAESPLSFEDAAERLRSLLMAAVAERLPATEAAALSLSGGWDSSAVYGLGNEVLSGQRHRDLKAVSISYPPGDPGREDEFILETTGHWNSAPHWISIDQIPLFEGTVEDASIRDEPFVHPFRNWNSALARAGRSLGARVMLDGYGGDQLFAGSFSYLAGLLREGRWLELMRRRREIARLVDPWSFFWWLVVPNLPPWMFDLVGTMRGRPLRGYFQQLPAPWIREDFIRRHDLLGRQHRTFPPGQASSEGATELRLYVGSPFFVAMCAEVSAYSLAAGLEQRSPLYDSRVISFAAGRPREDRQLAGETKRLLRRAVAGVVPAGVLAPRRHKTGTTGRYFLTSMQRDFPALSKIAFAKPLLPELGIVDLPALRSAVDHFVAGHIDSELTVHLFFTLQTELWLQARLLGSESFRRRFAVR